MSTATTTATATAAGSRLLMSATEVPKQQVHTPSPSTTKPVGGAAAATGGPTGTKRVYLFNEGKKEDKALLGGKGANLAEMSNIGLPVVRAGWWGQGEGRMERVGWRREISCGDAYA